MSVMNTNCSWDALNKFAGSLFYDRRNTKRFENRCANRGRKDGDKKLRKRVIEAKFKVKSAAAKTAQKRMKRSLLKRRRM